MNTVRNHRGRFVTLNIKARGRVKSVCAKVLSVTDKTVQFYSVNEKKVRRVLSKNLV